MTEFFQETYPKGVQKTPNIFLSRERSRGFSKDKSSLSITKKRTFSEYAPNARQRSDCRVKKAHIRYGAQDARFCSTYTYAN